MLRDQEKRMFRCKVCIHTKAKNVFVSGKDSSQTKKDDLTKLEISADHWRAMLLPKWQLEFMTASVVANDNAKLAIIVQMCTVLTQVKYCLLTVKNKALVDLQVLNMSVS